MFKNAIKYSIMATLLSLGLSAQAAPTWTKSCWEFLTKIADNSVPGPRSQILEVKLSITYKHLGPYYGGRYSDLHNFDLLANVDLVKASFFEFIKTSNDFTKVDPNQFDFDIRWNDQDKFSEHFFVIKPRTHLTRKQLRLLKEHLAQFDINNLK